MSAACVIGVDLGGTKALLGAVAARLEVTARERRVVSGLGQRELLEELARAVSRVAAAAPASAEAVGVGVPSLMDSRSGRAAYTVNLELRDVDVAAELSRRVGLPVYVDNDANCAVWAEHLAGAARGARNVVMLTVGTGIGSGLVLDGRLFRGATGAGAELGHMVVDADGPRCQGHCPNRGCLEAVASGPALLREARAAIAGAPDSGLARAVASGRALTGPLVSELADGGDALASSVLAEIGRRLGVGLANCLNVFNPDVVVVGGGVSAAGELLLGPARAEAARRALPPSREHAIITRARLGEEAGMIGAALLAQARGRTG